MNNKDYFKKNPELYIDKQKITFHYNREERLAKMPHKIKSDDSFFSSKNRHFHIIIINLILLLIIGVVISIFFGRAISQDVNGFKFYFSKKSHYDSPILDFRMQIKNIKKINNILDEDYREMEFRIYDVNENIVYSKEFYISKNILKPDEYYIEYLIVTKPKKDGKYKAIVYYGPNKNQNLSLYFTIKNK